MKTKKQAQAVVDCVFSTITKTLIKKGMVTLVGFGTLRVVGRKARKGRNPRTGAEISIKARKIPKFVPGKALRDAVSLFQYKRFCKAPTRVSRSPWGPFLHCHVNQDLVIEMYDILLWRVLRNLHLPISVVELTQVTRSFEAVISKSQE